MTFDCRPSGPLAPRQSHFAPCFIALSSPHLTPFPLVLLVSSSRAFVLSCLHFCSPSYDFAPFVLFFLLCLFLLFLLSSSFSLLCSLHFAPFPCLLSISPCFLAPCFLLSNFFGVPSFPLHLPLFSCPSCFSVCRTLPFEVVSVQRCRSIDTCTSTKPYPAESFCCVCLCCGLPHVCGFGSFCLMPSCGTR